MTILRFERVACRRGGRLLFEGLDLALAPGEALLVAGPNGVGKSSLLRLAGGLLEPAAGRIVREGEAALADERPALDPEQELARALGFWVDPPRRRHAVAGALAATGLSAIAEVPVRLLSTGQRRRAGLARVHAADAPLWLLDEPADGLDTAGVALLGAMVERHLGTGGAILAASHQPLPGAAWRRLELGQ